ncbi:ABC transporter ATP-binding protein [Xylophilus sp.]|uniref:ABC transporter ATP-binding protein n=1 Tax=Xylophilus sp. TaxID=2653893 RepID=UPI0013BA9470|nr:ABC transporter ATP-binding protein [Xylophilus sp.]KAF1046223.1 MAG: Teichoic acids export ATP-binding protein TagH [Xylophilus sp.]
MSSDTSVAVRGLRKRYEIYETPRHRLQQFVFPRIQRLLGLPVRHYFTEFWALQDVSFSVQRGETVAIIGRNGSGKSTLLQTICGTLHATEGEVETRGRIAALLELGSGFNPEFTGRENILMNAAILGLATQEVEARFDAIAAFADIGDFLDQPVKTYSSGMYVRLAFAVIAHVDADILIIDEALAVGDAVFTQKCMRFLREFKKRGTLIFVSHDMGSVLALCERAVWLHQGQVRDIGPSKSVAEKYLQYTLQEVYGDSARLEELEADTSAPTDLPAAPGPASAAAIDYHSQVSVQDHLAEANGWRTGGGEIVSVTLSDADGQVPSVLQGGETVRMTVQARLHQPMANPIIGFLVRDRLGQDLFGENTLPASARRPCSAEAGQLLAAQFVFRLPMLPNGTYSVMTSLADGDLYNNVQHHWLHDAVLLHVNSSTVRWGLVGVQCREVSLEVAE